MHPLSRRPACLAGLGRVRRLGYAGTAFRIWWNAELAKATARGDERGKSWGYGDRPGDIEEFYRRFEGLCAVLLDNPAVVGYCYTQLTDVFQEQNGMYGFDRTPEFDAARLRATQVRPAAIERLPGGVRKAD